MRSIQSYEDFINEEINIKRVLAGAALGAGLAVSNPAISQNDFSKSDKIENVISKDKINTKKTSFDIVDTMSKENGFNLSLKGDISKAKDVKLSYSIGYIQGIGKDEYPSQFLGSPYADFYQAPAGALFGLHIDNFSIYWDCKWFGKKDESNVSNWSEPSILNQYSHTYEDYYVGSAIYTTHESGTEIRTGSCIQNNRVTNISFGGKVKINKDYCFRGFLGVGVLNRTELTYQEVHKYWDEFTNYSLINQSSYDGSNNWEWNLIQKSQIYELNVHGGLMIEGGGVFAGVGFDTNPGTFNVSFGFTFGDK